MRTTGDYDMPLKYLTGEEIMTGDSVLLNGDPGTVEFIAESDTSDPDMLWYVHEFGSGVMISQLSRLGSVFIEDPEGDGDLKFVGRVPTARRI